MVTEKKMIEVSVRFPSMNSIGEFFNDGSGSKSIVKETDMDLNKAAQVLEESVPSIEFAQQKHHLVLISTKSKREGILQPELKRTEMVRWGVRRKVRFMGAHRDPPPPQPPQLRSCSQEEESKQRKVAVKRPAGTLTRQERKRKAARRERVIVGSSRERWSKERYDAAELKLMDIMRAKGAVLGNPILRPELRAEARKHIGDTGLLDHLLKHMAGKVDPERNERFRRRHNPDGAMEYWLEPADLIELRKEAGVQDPFWAPPPGWLPGDGAFLDQASAKEMKQLKEEMESLKRSSAMELKQLKDEVANMKRDFEQLLAREQQENEADTTPTSMKKAQFHTDGGCSFQESSLIKRKNQLEQQLLEISNTFNALQGEVSQLWEDTKKVEKKEERPCKVVRSGFRICKPHGTFLWPSNGGSMSPQVQMQVEDLLGVPTPTSASSATSRSNPFQLPVSPAKALPKIRTVAVSCVPQGPHNCAWKLFDDNGRLPQLQVLGDDGVAELVGQYHSDAVGMGTGISSSNSTIANSSSDHLAGQGDTAAKAWLTL